jgi:tRNA modification GTPase
MRGLIRVSGPQAFDVLRALLVERTIDDLPPRVLSPVRVALSPDISLPVLLARFVGPRSYTGQDMVELQCPGHPSLLERLLQRVLTLGARLAEPGEFTFRAFVAGKLDLTQAEGIHATISATNDAELRAAAQLREGKLGQASTRLVDDLATQLALTEAGIDFVDQDDVVPILPGALLAAVSRVRGSLDDLLRHSRSWGELTALPRVVLVGAPSAGKSTLFNALLGRTRAVVSDLPGTTRDVLAEPLSLPLPDGRSGDVMLLDIAGLDDAAALLDREAQHAATAAIAQADLLLIIDDGSGDPLPLDVTKIGTPMLRVRTKIDVVPTSDQRYDVRISAVTGAGMDDLRAAMATAVGSLAHVAAGDAMALQPRHEQSLRHAAAHLAEAIDLLAPQRDGRAVAHVELVAGALRSTLNELTSLGGTMTPDDIIGRVFATFCIGK